MIITAGEYLKSKGKAYPEADADGRIPLDRFQQAGIPAVCACATCTMTFVLGRDRPMDDQTGEVFCSYECAGVPDPDQQPEPPQLTVEQLRQLWPRDCTWQAGRNNAGNLPAIYRTYPGGRCLVAGIADHTATQLDVDVMAMAPQLGAVLADLLPTLDQNIEDSGPCDHSVGICVCGLKRQRDEVVALLSRKAGT